MIARNDQLDLRNISRKENFGLGSNFKFGPILKYGVKFQSWREVSKLYIKITFSMSAFQISWHWDHQRSLEVKNSGKGQISFHMKSRQTIIFNFKKISKSRFDISFQKCGLEVIQGHQRSKIADKNKKVKFWPLEIEYDF